MDWPNNIPKSIQGDGKPLEIGKETGWADLPRPAHLNFTSSSIAWREWLISQGYDVPEFKVTYNISQ